MQKRIGLLLIFMACMTLANAQNLPPNNAQQFTFNFRSNGDLFLKEYKNNAPQLNSIMTLIDARRELKIDSLIMIGSASPDGSVAVNRELSMRRVNSVWGYLAYKFPYIQEVPLRIKVAPSSWKEVVDEIWADPSTPNQAEVVAILEANSDDPMVMEQIKAHYMDAYTYIYNNIIPYKRNAMACIIFYTPQDSINGSIRAMPTEVDATPYVASEQPSVTPLYVATSEVATAMESPAQDSIIPAPVEHKPLFALKSNLLFDVATVLNIELEVPIGRRFSIAGEVMFPWWKSDSNQNCLQVFSGNIEGRYWFPRSSKKWDGRAGNSMTGWFTGVYAGGGYYDLEWDKKGYQGEFFIAAGISGGYVHSIGRNLRMEYSLGVGYMKTNYRQYEARQGVDKEWHLYNKNDGKFTWIGPTRAKVSLVWMINHKVK